MGHATPKPSVRREVEQHRDPVPRDTGSVVFVSQTVEKLEQSKLYYGSWKDVAQPLSQCTFIAFAFLDLSIGHMAYERMSSLQLTLVYLKLAISVRM